MLQEGEFERLGDSHSTAVDVRVIAATNRDLSSDVKAGKFREDLFYRLNVFPIHVPPLRERGDDIELLAEHFVARYATSLGKAIDSISRASLDRLRTHAWPGNVRELQNVIERAVILASGSCLHVDVTSAQPTVSSADMDIDPQPLRTLREMEVELITVTLDRCDWVVGGKSGAARLLDVPASTLRERIRKYGLTRRS